MHSRLHYQRWSLRASCYTCYTHNRSIISILDFLVLTNCEHVSRPSRRGVHREAKLRGTVSSDGFTSEVRASYGTSSLSCYALRRNLNNQYKCVATLLIHPQSRNTCHTVAWFGPKRSPPGWSRDPTAAPTSSGWRTSITLYQRVL